MVLYFPRSLTKQSPSHGESPSKHIVRLQHLSQNEREVILATLQFKIPPSRTSAAQQADGVHELLWSIGRVAPD